MEAEERPYKRRRLTPAEESLGAQPSSQVDEIENASNAEKLAEPRSDGTSQQPGSPNTGVDDFQNEELEASHQNGNLSSEAGETSGLPPPNETAPLATLIPDNQDDPPLSKTQQKKLRKKAEWESKRDERKAVRKEKNVAKRERRRAERQQAIGENGGEPPPPPVTKVKAQKPVTLPVTILIDCDFDDLMRDNERISLASQVTRSYSDNKNAMFRAHLAVCSFGGKLRERFDNILPHYKGWRGVRFLDCDFVDAAEKAKEWMSDEKHGGAFEGTFKHLATEDESVLTTLKSKSEIVYLTSEADDTLTELKPYSTYIIGGLVDKNREKGICYKRGTQRGVKTAKLPIGEFMDMQSRKVLATNHVNEIVLKWLECGDWGEAFMRVIPKRKGGKLKDEVEKEGSDLKDGHEEVDDEGAGEVDEDETGDASVDDVS